MSCISIQAVCVKFEGLTNTEALVLQFMTVFSHEVQFSLKAVAPPQLYDMCTIHVAASMLLEQEWIRKGREYLTPV